MFEKMFENSKKIAKQRFLLFFGCRLRGAGCGLMRAGKKACGLRARPACILSTS